MNRPLAERDERFVYAIADRLPADRVVEVYFFPPLRQGPTESGVAVITLADVAGGDSAVEAAPATPASAGERHAVYTATYRHTRKGPDRGAWSVEVVAQADAPLAAVAAAVRGVYRRAGDDDMADATRLTGAEFRSLLGARALGAAPATDGSDPTEAA